MGKSESRVIWMAVGLAAGVCLTYFWPHEPALSAASDRSSKFGMATCSATSGLGVAGEVEAVFVLDYYTGRLSGGILDPKSGKFTASYFRNVAADFQVDPKAEPNYAMVTGKLPLNAKGRQAMANGTVYIGELTSGRINAYGFPYIIANRPTGPMEMEPLDTYSFREKQ